MSSGGPQLREAVEYFWASRRQRKRERSVAFAGRRGEVVGARHFNGFISALREQLVRVGVPEGSIHFRRSLTYLPG